LHSIKNVDANVSTVSAHVQLGRATAPRLKSPPWATPMSDTPLAEDQI
jgi:hypothetical protein